MVARTPPTGLLKQVLAVPAVLNRLGLGRLLGKRLITIAHVGRKSGARYETTVEVVFHDPDRPEWTVIAAWDERPDWLANLEQRSALAVTVAGRTYDEPEQRRLPREEALDVLAAYAAAHPLAMRVIFRIVGFPDPRRPGGLREVAEKCPMLAFAPRSH